MPSPFKLFSNGAAAAVALAWITLAAGACGGVNSPSAGSPSTGDTAQTDTAQTDATKDGTAGKSAIQIDFLWMIDHSSSMCQEQQRLAAGFQGFVTELESAAVAAGAGGIDAQMAVVTVQQLPDSTEIKKVGQFVHKPATDYPPACVERVKYPCLKDADCTKPVPFQFYNYDPDAGMCVEGGQFTPEPLPAGSYACKANTDNPQFNSNDNCSVNSTCQLRCTTDADCYAMYEPGGPNGELKVMCNKATTTPGCMFTPPTKDCPAEAELPAIVKQSQTLTDADGKVIGSQLDLFHCLASVGAIQTKEAKFEGGLRSLWQALDPKGENCPSGSASNCQNTQLIRPGALLVLIAISDDDDCSYAMDVTPDPKGAPPFDSQFQAYCQMYGDSAAGNPDLINGTCKYAQFKDKLSGKPLRTCPTDCLPLTAGSPERATCESDAAVSVADLLANTPFLKSPLIAPVSDFVQRVQSLKDKPERVLFATIAGDSTVTVAKKGLTLADQKALDRASYYRAFLRNQASLQAPYICSGPTGEAGYGSRYFAVAKAMGASGFAYNLCDPSGLGATLQALAGDIAKRAVQLGM
ncbi:MAG: hypothetical protein HY902_07555 [Deltaproteobacteria bacterium]|nr:hypothetical protein [Deltaproteobacteria bacterium]